jgi:putative Holliday junction resolvase
MAVDHGLKKIGIAFCDEMEILASPYAVLQMDGGATVERLAAIAGKEGAAALLVGLPLHRDGAESSTAAAAREFGLALAGRTGLPLEFINEHLTTHEAAKMLSQRGRKGGRRGRAEKTDAAAAAVMLMEHMENRKGRRTGGTGAEAEWRPAWP